MRAGVGNGQWPGRRADADSAAALVSRELTWLALVAMAAWIVESPSLWPWTATGGTAVALWAVVVAWIGLLVAQAGFGPRARRWAGVVVVTVCLLASVVASVPVSAAADWEAGASLAMLGAGLAGALLPWRPALVVIGAVVVGTLEGISRLDLPTGPLGVPTPLVPGHAAALGGSLLLLRLALERNATRLDRDVRRRDEADRQRGRVAGVEEALQRQERLLHETVLNTLTAISRGGLGSGPATAAALEARCREAVDVLTRLRAGAQALSPPATVTPIGFVSIGEDLAASIEALRADGLPVEVVTDSLEDVPDRVRGALATAIRECLANTARHARASRASVLIRVRRKDGVSVRAEVRDDGVGFDPATTPGRFGLARAVRGPMEEVGGTATIHASPGQGTRVVLDWRDRTADALDRGPWREFGLPPLATVAAFVAALVSVVWLEYAHPPAGVTDIAFIAVLAVLIALATPEAPLPWPLVITVATLRPLLALLAATPTGSPFVDDGWALAAVAALYMVVAAIGPPWAWVVLLAAWVLGEPSVSVASSDLGILVIVGGALFGRALRRDIAAMERSHERRIAAETALDVTREGVGRLRSRYEALEDSSAAELLDGILAGTLDPDDPEVRRRAGLEESFIRTMIRVDPGADDLRRLAAGLARAAHRRQVPFSIELALPPEPSIVVPAPVAGSFSAAMGHAAADAPARLTARLQGDVVVATLLLTVDEGEVDRMRALPVPGEVTDPDDPADRTLLWEARLTSLARP